MEQARLLTPENCPMGAIINRMMQNLGIPSTAVNVDQTRHSASRLHIIRDRAMGLHDYVRRDYAAEAMVEAQVATLEHEIDTVMRTPKGTPDEC